MKSTESTNIGVYLHTDIMTCTDIYFNAIAFRDKEGKWHMYNPIPENFRQVSEEYVAKTKEIYESM